MILSFMMKYSEDKHFFWGEGGGVGAERVIPNGI